MPRPKVPSEIAAITGYRKSHPSRFNDREPRPSAGIGEYPKNPAMDAAGCWNEIVDNACPHVLSCADRYCVEIAAHLMAEFRQSPTEFTAARLTVLERCLGKMGMSPVDRTRVVAVTEEQSNPEDAYFD